MSEFERVRSCQSLEEMRPQSFEGQVGGDVSGDCESCDGGRGGASEEQEIWLRCSLDSSQRTDES